MESTRPPGQCTSDLEPLVSGEYTSVDHALPPGLQSAQTGHYAVLLDLPVELITDIIARLTKISDLLSLSVCHSALHALIAPRLYGDLDVDWPRWLTPSSRRQRMISMDTAISTLSTLFVPPDHYGQATSQNAWNNRGIFHARYIKRFSIARLSLSVPNPSDLDIFYFKDTGKTIAGLVAIGIARMPNLETFIWGPTTGISEEVWSSLARLASRPEPCRLQEVWVNCAHIHMSRGEKPQGPKFSVLPPLASINAVRISELYILDEMSELIERSLDKLRELRISTCLLSELWPLEEVHGEQVWQQSPSDSRSHLPGERLGGVLGVLSGCFFDLRHCKLLPRRVSKSSLVLQDKPGKRIDRQSSNEVLGLEQSVSRDSAIIVTERPMASRTPLLQPRPVEQLYDSWYEARQQGTTTVLHLNVLELQLVPLSMPVLTATIDWQCVTTLTILSCANHDRLWDMLRRGCLRYRQTQGSARRGTDSVKHARSGLSIKVIHTNEVTAAFLSFVADGLDPNTLEEVYLQDMHPVFRKLVDRGSIYQHVLQRHASSLRKMLVSSRLPTNMAGSDTAWQDWAFDRDMLAFVSSGKMPRLRELGLDLYPSDFGAFLGSLPGMPQVRSLLLNWDLPIEGRNTRSTAFKFRDAVRARPDIKLRYIGIYNECYEIREFTRSMGRPQDQPTSAQGKPDTGPAHHRRPHNQTGESRDIKITATSYDLFPVDFDTHNVSTFKRRTGWICL